MAFDDTESSTLERDLIDTPLPSSEKTRAVRDARFAP